MANRGRHQKKIETVHWTVGNSINSLGQAINTNAAFLLFPAQHLPETLLRMRGEWVCSLVTTQASASGSRVIAGIIQVPEGTGTTVLWDPSGDGDAPWIWWDTMQLMYVEYVADQVSAQAAGSARRVIDSKAMRKQRNTELQFVISTEDPGALTGVSVNVLAVVRALSGS